MSLLDNILSLLAPHECLGCNVQGALICNACADKLPKIASRCYRCRRLSPNSLTCKKCRHSSRLSRVKVLTVYDGIAKEIVWSLKYSGAIAAAATMARTMSQQIEHNPKSIIVPVPTTTKRIRQRGYDQAALIAKEISKQTGLTYWPCLAKTSQAHQVGASRSQRIKQLHDAFRLANKHRINGANIILIDDVITTGATLESAALILKRSGASRVDALVFAQP